MATESFDDREGTGLGPDLSWSTIVAGFATTGGTAYLPTSEVDALERCEEDLGSDDMAVEIVFAGTGSTSYCDMGVCLRVSSDGATRYSVKMNRSGGNERYELRRFVNATGPADFDQLISSTLLSWSDGDVFRAEIEGNVIRIYQNAVLVDTYTDDDDELAIASGHFAGIDAFRSNLASGTNVRITSFSAEAIGGGSSPEGGSEASVTVSAAGAGVSGRSGGSASSVTVTASGAGTSGRSGGSGASVSVSASGAGAKHAEGGSEATVTVTASGAGVAEHSGGSEASVTVTSAGAGNPGSDSPEGGSTTPVTVTAAGVGTSHREGGSTATVTITATGAGVPQRQSGSGATVTIAATGGGTSGDDGSPSVHATAVLVLSPWSARLVPGSYDAELVSSPWSAEVVS